VYLKDNLRKVGKEVEKGAKRWKGRKEERD